ncbi:MAG: ABC transporter permease, partial [Desulfobulbaceae bacterium]
GGVIFYSFLYPLPYSRQVLREQAVVVVNLDGSAISRRLERMVDATPQVCLSGRASSLKEAESMMLQDRLAGILVIPRHFHRDLLLGRVPTLSYAGDASYFLVYSTVLEGLNAAGRTLASEVKINHLLRGGQPLSRASEQYTAIRMNPRPVFNTTLGYVNYVVPAVFVLILHQTLVMGVGVLGGEQKNLPGRRREYWREVPAWRLILVRALVFGLIYCLLAMYYFGFCFSLYGIARLAAVGELCLLVLPFLLAAVFLGICLGQLLPRPELVTLVVLLSSMPLVFSSGFVWPVSAIPEPVTFLVQIVPAVPAIQAFLRINQMGAGLSGIMPLWGQLWLHCLVYGSLAWWLLARARAQNSDPIDGLPAA